MSGALDHLAGLISEFRKFEQAARSRVHHHLSYLLKVKKKKKKKSRHLDYHHAAGAVHGEMMCFQQVSRCKIDSKRQNCAACIRP